MRRLALLLVAAAASAAGVLVGPAEADATPPARPACEGVRFGDQFRVFVDPGTVVAGVVEARSGSVGLRGRADGVWVGTVPVPSRPFARHVHVVLKSDAARFSERRWSGWLRCRTVKP